MLSFIYKTTVKPTLFLFDAEFIHHTMTSVGNTLGKFEISKNITKSLFYYKHKSLSQKINGVNFDNPIGLSAGFDYDADLTQIIGDVGFGFSTIGTVTNIPYEGNPAPRLGRLPKSKSLLVNKGFKSKGAEAISRKLNSQSFSAPIGVSIGRSNSSTLKTIDESIEDIKKAFKTFEKSKVKNAYYELNISCPNLIHGAKNITFYPPKNLEKLLKEIDSLKLKKPLFIKMPISEDDKSFVAILKVVVKHKVDGIIIGNLLKDRSSDSFDKTEIKNATMGNFSGAPCRRRSSELIALAYKHTAGKLVIIGCGGVFNARDAYEKIKLGSSLIMMITGMIYEGPQVVGQINRELVELLREDGYKNISEARGAYFR